VAMGCQTSKSASLPEPCLTEVARKCQDSLAAAPALPESPGGAGAEGTAAPRPPLAKVATCETIVEQQTVSTTAGSEASLSAREFHDDVRSRDSVPFPGPLDAGPAACRLTCSAESPAFGGVSAEEGREALPLAQSASMVRLEYPDGPWQAGPNEEDLPLPRFASADAAPLELPRLLGRARHSAFGEAESPAAKKVLAIEDMPGDLETPWWRPSRDGLSTKRNPTAFSTRNSCFDITSCIQCGGPRKL